MSAKSEASKKTTLDEYVETPIAAKLPAEPGWRVVFFRNMKEREDGLVEVAIEVRAVEQWALDATTIVPGPAESPFAMQIAGLFGGFIPKTPLRLWPIDPSTGLRFGKDTHRLVPPCSDTDAQLIEAAQLWCAESVEKSKKSTP